MSVNLLLLVQKPLLIFGLAVCYLAIKAPEIYSTGRFFRMNHFNARKMGMTIALGGEFAFVIFGQVAGLADTGLIDILTAVVTVSVALNTLIIMLDDALQKNKKGRTGLR